MRGSTATRCCKPIAAAISISYARCRLATQDEKIAAASNATADETEREEAYRPLAVKRSLFARLNRPVIDFVARLPLRLEIKLLFVFLGAVGLLVLLGI